jgi:broad specificity phosphatase PhoE
MQFNGTRFKGEDAVELIFIRHGQGEHTLDLPASLQLADPGLTKDGVSQVKSLQTKFTLTEKDIVVISH